LFQSNHSGTWSTQGIQNGIDGAIFSLNTFEEGNLGLLGNASYGFDTVNLGLPGSGLPTLEKQVIAGYWTNAFYLGSLGLSPVPFNFTDLNNPLPSMLESLYNQSLVPSRSWAYTAGAHYQEPPVFGSLTLGGFETTRFEPNNLTFAFGADFSRDLLVSLHSITYDTIGSFPLLTRSIDIFIDSLVTEVWLPVSVCHAFAQQFNLTWNTQGQLYLVEDEAHAALVAQNPTFTFKIGHSGGGGEVVDIVLPYAAFDLNLTAPIVGNTTRYFPLKQAQNSTQYTLGRVFLQEAYVVADYERRNFSVSQALFPATSIAGNLVAIHPPGYDMKSKSRVKGGLVAGIAIAILVVLVAATLTAIFWYKNRSKRKLAANGVTSPERPTADLLYVSSKPELDANHTSVYEINDEQSFVPPELPAHEGPCGRHELVSEDSVHEMAGSGAAMPK
jgi:hypothetical protein